MKKLGFLAAVVAMLVGFISCEKVEPTALETSDLKSATLTGYVYYNKLNHDGLLESKELLESGEVNILVNDGVNTVLIKTPVEGGKYSASIPVALGRSVSCSVYCLFEVSNYDEEVNMYNGGQEYVYRNVKVQYEARTNVSVAYGKIVIADITGARTGVIDVPFHNSNY